MSSRGNDDVIALNQFAAVLTSASEGVASAMNTEAKGTSIVIFNPLGISREDIVEASVDSSKNAGVRVVGPDGKEVPAQMRDSKVVFSRKRRRLVTQCTICKLTLRLHISINAASFRKLTRK
jgi:hypothetical protein